MPRIAIALVLAATAIIVAIAAAVLGNIGLHILALRPDVLVGLVLAAGVGLVTGLVLLERNPQRWPHVA
jgi:hypothetical protein